MYHSFIKKVQGACALYMLNYWQFSIAYVTICIRALYGKACMKHICDISVLRKQKHLMLTLHDGWGHCKQLEAWPSQSVCMLEVVTHSLIWFIRTSYETVNIIWCICWLFHSQHQKLHVFTCIFSISSFTRYCSNTNQVRWIKFILSHVTFICKSSNENGTKIRWYLTKLQTKLNRLLLLWPTTEYTPQ